MSGFHAMSSRCFSLNFAHGATATFLVALRRSGKEILDRVVPGQVGHDRPLQSQRSRAPGNKERNRDR